MKNRRWISIILAGSVLLSCATSTFAREELTGPLLIAQGGAPNVEIEKEPDSQNKSPSQPPSPSPKTSATPTPEQKTAKDLYNYLQKNFLRVAKDESGARLIWTDTIMLEVENSLPPEPLATVIKDAPSNNETLATWIRNTFEKQITAWHPGTKSPHPKYEGTDEIVNEADGTHCYLNPVYFSYLEARYPEAKILIRSSRDPVLFTVNGQICAVLGPWTTLPDGTPLL